MSNPEQPAGWSDQSWQPMPPTAPNPVPGYPPPTGSPVPGYPPPTGSPVPGYPQVTSPGQVPGQTMPMYPPTSGTPGYPTSGATAGYPQGAYQAPYAAGYGYGYPPAVSTPTNGMAIGSMVVSIVSLAGLCAYGFGGLLGILGAILGHIARRQIRERGEGGDGMALAGIIMGWIATGLAVIIIGLVVFFVWLAVTSDQNTLADLDGVRFGELVPAPARP